MNQKIINKWYRYNSRLFYQSLSFIGHNLQKIELIDCKSGNDFYKKIIKIKDTDQSIIFQSHNDYQFSSQLLNRLYNSKSFDQFSFFEIYSRTNRSLKTKLKIQKKIPIYIFKFSFKSASEIPNIFRSFFIPFSLQDGTLKQKYQFQKKKFSQFFSDSNGLCLDGETCVLLFLNQDNYTQLTIKHQLCHYFQFISSKKYQNIQQLELEHIKQLQLNREQLQYLLDQKEFQAHIKVDLIQQFQQIYYKFFRNKTKIQFINYLIQTVKEDPLHVVDKFIMYLLQCKNKDITSLRLFGACYILSNKKYLKKALQWIYQKFKQ